MTTELELYHRIGIFIEKTFPDATVRGHLRKLAGEVVELIENQTDIKEYADCFICLCAAANKQGYTWDELLKAAEQKMTINEIRTWIRLPDGTYQHKPL